MSDPHIDLVRIGEAEHVLGQALAAERALDDEYQLRKQELVKNTARAHLDLLRAMRIAWADRADKPQKT